MTEKQVTNSYTEGPVCCYSLVLYGPKKPCLIEKKMGNKKTDYRQHTKGANLVTEHS